MATTKTSKNLVGEEVDLTLTTTFTTTTAANEEHYVNSSSDNKGGGRELDLCVKGQKLTVDSSPSPTKLETTKVCIPKVSLANSVQQGETEELPDPNENCTKESDCMTKCTDPACEQRRQPPPPPEDMGVEINITTDFFEAVKSLELGELLHDPSFGLFEAMSAIEMMDPKMDAGMICNKGKRTILNFDQAVQEGALKLENLTYDELIGVFDTTVCCLVTWIEGHSLAQTVFTNLYLHKPTAIGDKYLKATSIAALKLVDVIEECISKAGVFEEEDFQPSVYGYNLATMFTDSKAASMLRECEDDLQKKVRMLAKNQLPQLQQKTTADVDGTVACATATNDSSAVNAPAEDITHDIEMIDALLGRLKFIRMFHSLILHIWKRDDSECATLITGCQDTISLMQKSAHLGIQRNTCESESFMVGFELLVNQRLLPPTFPRSTKIKTNEEAFGFLEGLLQRIKTVLKITTLQNFHGIVDFFHAFSETRPCVLSRSFLQLLYGPMRFKKPGIDEMIDAMKESVKSFISPPVLAAKFKGRNREVSECVDMFFERCATVFANLLIACGHNRARQRDKLAHLMDDFAGLQNETEKIDSYISSLCLQMEGVRPHGNCFGTWLLCHISKLMIRYILSGFELELYSLHEFAYIYWYLHEFLYAWLLLAYNRADAFIAEGESSNYDKQNKKSGKNRQKNSKAKSKAYTKELLILQAEQSLTGGYFKALMGLINDNRIPFPNTEFDNESVRYRHRFAPFAPIQTPPLVHFVQYKSVAEITANEPSVNLYVDSARRFQQAKQLLEAVSGSEKEVAELLKIAKTNFVVVKLLASGHTKESCSPPEFDFSTHMHFPVMKVR